jgi:hypothetical protein
MDPGNEGTRNAMTSLCVSSYHTSIHGRFCRDFRGRSEQLMGHKTQVRIRFSPTVGPVQDGGPDSWLKRRATDRDRPDGEQQVN